MINEFISVIIILITIISSNTIISNQAQTDWYNCIEPEIAPSKKVFSIVWGLMYILLYFAFTKVLYTKNKFLIGIFSIHFILQIAWSYTFFRLRRIDYSLLMLQLLIFTGGIIINTVTDKQIKYLLYPYLTWLLFALVMNILSLRKDYCNFIFPSKEP
jgi:benzodiazapine receptor